MRGIWGSSTNRKLYSLETIKLIKGLLKERRPLFRMEFKSALSNPRETSLMAGERFESDDRIITVLESNVEESTFKKIPVDYIDSVLMGACESDYYYNYEKEY